MNREHSDIKLVVRSGQPASSCDRAWLKTGGYVQNALKENDSFSLVRGHALKWCGDPQTRRMPCLENQSNKQSLVSLSGQRCVQRLCSAAT